MNAKAPRLSWRRQPNEKGLASVSQGERGWLLYLGKLRVGTVAPRHEGWGRTKIGYYWYARLDPPEPIIPLENTASRPVKTVGQAIVDLEKYILAHLPAAKINRAALTKAGIEIPKDPAS